MWGNINHKYLVSCVPYSVVFWDTTEDFLHSCQNIHVPKVTVVFNGKTSQIFIMLNKSVSKAPFSLLIKILSC